MLTFATLRLLLGSVIKKLIDGLAWCINHWKIVAPIVIVAVIIWQFHRVTSERDAIQQKYTQHLKDDKEASDQRIQQNKDKDNQAKLAQGKQKLQHADDINAIRRKYDALHHQETDAHTDDIQRWRDRLRIELAKNTANGLPGIQHTTEPPTESGGDSDAATLRQRYETLETACKVTTADYNSLWNSWQESCMIFGCK